MRKKKKRSYKGSAYFRKKEKKKGKSEREKISTCKVNGRENSDTMSPWNSLFLTNIDSFLFKPVVIKFFKGRSYFSFCSSKKASDSFCMITPPLKADFLIK